MTEHHGGDAVPPPGPRLYRYGGETHAAEPAEAAIARAAEIVASWED